MRDAVKISNESFRIKSNISSRDTNFKQQEAFLSHIEESTDTTLAAQLSRKLASILPPDLAYNFLLAAKFPNHPEGNSFEISLQKKLVPLSSMWHTYYSSYHKIAEELVLFFVLICLNCF